MRPPSPISHSQSVSQSVELVNLVIITPVAAIIMILQ